MAAAPPPISIAGLGVERGSSLPLARSPAPSPARLLLNLLLVRSGYPPAVIYTRDRNRYLRARRRADAGDPGPLGELIARAVTDNLYRFVVPAVAGPKRLVPLASLASKEHTVLSLRVAIERGRLKGQKNPDGQWRSTRAWLDEYIASKYKRRA